MRFLFSLFLVTTLATTILAAPPDPPGSPVSPQDSLKYFQLDAGLKIELAAYEPEVIDPIAIRFDEHERMWVVEMGDYPLGPAAGQPPLSRIRILEDRDKDGRYETSRVFVDKLPFITGVQPWKGGAFVTLAGKVAYMKDLDGDGRADQNETWFTGFAEENSQLRANHPRLALDGWIYVANGLRGGTVLDARKADAKPISISGRDFRFHPTTGEYEAISGTGQFGMAFDDGGRRFVVSNRNPMIHVVLEDRYLKKNPVFAVASVVQDVAKSGEASRIYPLTRAWTTSNLHAGQFTAACGVKIFGGHGLAAEYRGNVFTCDPTGNLIHREVVDADGASFQSKLPYAEREFLASTDEWFRPVNTETGPDGAFYVVDMYRAVIEHPQFVPDELKNRPDQRLGDDLGRIYRVTSSSPPTVRAATKIAGATGEELLAYLGHPNTWKRETAARLILEKPERTSTVLLEKVAANGNALAKLHALWLLHNLKQLKDDVVADGLKDPSPLVRETAVTISESRLRQNSSLRKQVLALASDTNPRVRFQVALVLAPCDEPEVEALAQIFSSGLSDIWTRRAVAIASGDHAEKLTVRLLRDPAFFEKITATDGKDAAAYSELVALVAASKEDRSLRTLFNFLLPLESNDKNAWLQRVGLTVVAQSLARQSTSLTKKLEQLQSPEFSKAFEGIVKNELAAATNKMLSAPRRIEAVELLGFVSSANEPLAKLAQEEPEQAVRLRAIAAMGRHGNADQWRKLVAGFKKESPTTRRAIVEGMLASRERTKLLLDEVASGSLKVNELDRLQADRLLKNSDEEIRERAKKLLASAIPADREKALADYQIVFKLPDDPSRGRTVFTKNCATCHRIGDIGVNVAPDISDSRVKLPTQLLTDILQPNRAIDNNYISYVVTTNDGRTMVGLLATETAGSITLRLPENKTASFLRSEIEDIQSTGQSLMPEGLEKNIPPSDMADLISFIKNWRYLDGKTPFDRKKE